MNSHFAHLDGVIKELFESKYSLTEPVVLFKKKSCEYNLHNMQGFLNVAVWGEYNKHSDMQELKFHKTIL